MTGTAKTCFVIAPIGKPGSEIRIRSDQVFKHIIVPATSACGYSAVRADQISEPGLITSQVIQRLVSDPLVVADLTGSNANVFYELAIRHAARKPVIQIIDAAENIPFDVAATRTIHLDYRDLDSAATAREQIANQIRAVELNPSEVDTPIGAALRLKILEESEDPLKRSNAEIISMLQLIGTTVGDLRTALRTSVSLAPLNDLRRNIRNLREGFAVIGTERRVTEVERSAISSLLDTCESAIAQLARDTTLVRPSDIVSPADQRLVSSLLLDKFNVVEAGSAKGGGEM